MDKRKRDLYLRILRTALLNIRMLGWKERAPDCALEADHVHNVPQFLVTEDPGAEKYYWEVERKIYLERLGPTDRGDRASFDSLWNEIKRLDAMPEAYTIYIPLVTSGSPTFRPTTGLKMDTGTYRVLPAEDYDPAKETWQFPPGSIVECEARTDIFPAMLFAMRKVG